MDEDEVAPVAATTKRSYQSIKEKLDLCLESEKVVNQEKKLSFRQFCHNHGVAPSNLWIWKTNIKMLKEAVISKKSSNKTLNKGNPTSLHHIKDALWNGLMGNVKKGCLCLPRWLFYKFQEWIPLFVTRKQGQDILLFDDS